MNRVDQKRKARHARSKVNRHDRFISTYVRRKNKDVYEEAERFYQQLDQKYPSKRDLTITDEFFQHTTEYTSAYCFAQAKYMAKYKAEKSNSQEAKGMVLEIPLMDKTDLDITVMCQKVDQSLCIPEHVYNQLLTEIAKDPVMNSIFNNIDIEQPPENDERQELNSHIDIEQPPENDERQELNSHIDMEQPPENDERQELNSLLDELEHILPTESMLLEQELENLVCQ